MAAEPLSVTHDGRRADRLLALDRDLVAEVLEDHPDVARAGNRLQGLRVDRLVARDRQTRRDHALLLGHGLENRDADIRYARPYDRLTNMGPI